MVSIGCARPPETSGKACRYFEAGMAEGEKQVKSRERVREHGEVFTAEREVKAMLDLVKDECENIDATFLEPACGDGNFLDEILRRKLGVCRKKYAQSAADYEKFSFLACTTLYGVDILADNVQRCRERLFATWCESFEVPGVTSRRGVGLIQQVPGVASRRGAGPIQQVPGVTSRRGTDKLAHPSDFHDRVARAVRFVFSRNILLGNALSMKRVDEQQRDLPDPIVFTEWKFALGDKLKRSEFRFDVLLESGGSRAAAAEMTFDFFDDASSSVNWMVDPDDPEKRRMIPAPSKTYAPVDYWRLGDE